MDRSPVTNRLFRIYHEVCGLEWQPDTWDTPLFSTPQQPVTGISMDDALAFCEWRSRLREQRVRLPTEAEWLRAALGDDGRTYPWGNEAPDYTRAFFALAEDADAVPAPVGLFPAGASPFGALDMAGNVWEITSASRGEEHAVLLGGACSSEAYTLNPRVALTLAADPPARDCRSRLDVGFRCVVELPEG
jgi:formylglycine-generating enzyme required for sulfatase activity